MPTDIYIGDIPIEEAYLGDDPIEMDDNNVCRPCYAYTMRRQSSPTSPATWVSASNCYNNETYIINANSAVTRVYAASENIAFGPNGVFGFSGLLSDGQGQGACKNAYGKEEYLPCESWTFTNTSAATFNYLGYYGCDGQWNQSLLNLNGFGGDTITACIQSGSFISLVSSSYNGPC